MHVFAVVRRSGKDVHCKSMVVAQSQKTRALARDTLITFGRTASREPWSPSSAIIDHVGSMRRSSWTPRWERYHTEQSFGSGI